MSESAVPIERAPLLGEHTDEVLAQDLGMAAGELRTLRKAGILG
jgi:crotonobetainyl-CoA:carnitine CoA-transferase CaiB-like acyl-CoA transferase